MSSKPQTGKPNIAYAGMTHLGLCSSIGGASKGFAMLGFDADAALVARLDQGKLAVLEPDLDDLLAANRDHIAFTSDPARLKDCDVVYAPPMCPPTIWAAATFPAWTRCWSLCWPIRGRKPWWWC